jgi:putative transposase
VRQLAAALKKFSLIAEKPDYIGMTTSWHHGPPHVFVPEGIYIVTGGTLDKAHFFKGADRLEFLQDTLLATLEKFGWIIQAWAVFVNHYHFIAQALQTQDSISSLIKELHSITAREVNRLDGIVGRQVWFQYWDTCLTYERSWLARLNYVNNNAVHHKLVDNAVNYPCCSATWFQQKADATFRRKVNSFRYDRLTIVDDF